MYFNLFVKFNERPRIIFNAIICHQSLEEGKAEIEHKLNLNKKDTMPNIQNNILPPPNIVPSNMSPPPSIMAPSMNQPSHIITSKTNITTQIPNSDFKKSISEPINYGNPPQSLNHMMNNNMNNAQDEELPSMEEVERSQFMNNNNMDYNFSSNNNNKKESYLHVYNNN